MFNANNWFMNESLDFYLSTNTFSNPVFDDNQLGLQHNISTPTRTTTAATQVQEQTENKESKRVYSNYCSSKNTLYEIKNKGSDLKLEKGNENEMEKKEFSSSSSLSGTQKEPSQKKQNAFKASVKHTKQEQQNQMWSNFCDNLVFSVKSKIFVLELNFKSKIRSLRKFANGHLPLWSGIFHNHQDYHKAFASSASACGRRGSKRLTPTNSSDCFTSSTSSAGGGLRDFGFGEVDVNQRLLAGSDLINDGGAFWKDIEEPNSRDSLSHQQEKILSRLEVVVQAKRSNQLRLQLLRDQLGEDQLSSMSSRASTNVKMGVASASAASAFESSSTITPMASKENGAARFVALGGRRVGVEQSPSAEGIKPSAGFWSKASNSVSSLSPRSATSSTSSGGGATVAPQGLTTTPFARETSNKVCIVCYSNPPNILTLPCKHHEICSDCFIEIIYLSVKQSQYPLKCVLCRQKIERIKCSRGLLLNVIPS